MTSKHFLMDGDPNSLFLILKVQTIDYKLAKKEKKNQPWEHKPVILPKYTL